MTLKQYAKHINELAKKYPKAKVVYAIDEEGNGYKEVYFNATIGDFEDGDFLPENAFEEFQKDGYNCKVNAVCIN